MQRKITQHQEGFALIEMIIYVGLFGILIGGILVSVFQLSTNAYRTDENISTHEEMNFVVKKLDWALSDASNISVSSGDLIVTNPNISGNTLIFAYDDSDPDYKTITLKVGAGSADPLTTTNVSVEDVVFQDVSTPNAPKGVKINIDIDGSEVEFEKYIKYVP
jgi:type II secretory pathway pseudopilin PulG